MNRTGILTGFITKLCAKRIATTVNAEYGALQIFNDKIQIIRQISRTTQTLIENGIINIFHEEINLK